MIKANFSAYDTYVTDSLHQWDIDRVLRVTGLNLTAAPEVHFSNANVDRALVRQSEMVDHVVSVKIPNSLLQDPLRIYAHIGIYEGSTFKVVECVEIPVQPRKRPLDYQIEDTDEEVYSFKRLENMLGNKADSAEVKHANAATNARIDTIVANTNKTDGNSELVDVRVDKDGTTHASAGASVRAQTKRLAEAIDHLRNGNISFAMGALRHGFYRDMATEADWVRGAIDNTGAVATSYKHCLSSNGFIDASGAVLFSANWSIVSYINIHEYDNSGAFVQTKSHNAEFTLAPVTGAQYKMGLVLKDSSEITDVGAAVRSAGIVAYTDELPFLLPVDMKGLSWNCVGDSITYEAAYYYDAVVKETGLTGARFAVPGSTLAVNATASAHIYANNNAFGTKTSICERVLAGGMGQADIWTVFGGTNDWYYDSALGELTTVGGSFDKTTVYGALQALCEYILNQSNHPKLVLITPLQSNRARYNGGTISHEAIRRAIIDVATLYSVPCLDLWATGGFNALNVNAKTDPTTSDGVHPTEYGAKMFRPKIIKALEALIN